MHNYLNYLLLSAVIITISSVSDVKSARILTVFPVPSKSHQVVFRKYVQALSKAGHEIVMITTDPFPPSKNVTVIDVSVGYGILAQLLEMGKANNKLPRGVIMDVTEVNAENYFGLLHIYMEEFKLPDVQKLLNDKNQHFDLVIIEAVLEYPLYFSKIFKAPTIQMSSYYGTSESYNFMGAIARHPLYFPDHSRNKFKYNSIWDKLIEIYHECRLFFEFALKMPAIQNVFLKSALGEEAPTVQELRNNVDLMLINANPIFDNNRPVPPNVVYLGSLHLDPVKDLPKDLQVQLDNSKRGVIFVSLGTNVKTDMMDIEYLEVFIKAFKDLPYDVLWKFDSDELAGKPENLIVRKWFPQRDLLMHKNVKLFITQGGLQSTDEAVDACVPMVAIPALADQWYNGHKYEELGIGVLLDPHTLTSDDIVKAANRVIEDNSFRKNLKNLRKLVNDQPQTPMERAVWWTEYVLRHKGAKHLRPSGFNVEWSEFLMLDVVIPILASFLSICLVTVILVIIVILKLLRKLNNNKNNVSMKIKKTK